MLEAGMPVPAFAGLPGGGGRRRPMPALAGRERLGAVLLAALAAALLPLPGIHGAAPAPPPAFYVEIAGGIHGKDDQAPETIHASDSFSVVHASTTGGG